MPKISKRFLAISAKVEDRSYSPLEAIELVQTNANAKFDETLEAHVRLGIDPKYTDQQLRTTVALPLRLPAPTSLATTTWWIRSPRAR